jgi:hypothetical protein
MATGVVHFAIVNRDRTVTPLCGEWHHGANWTTVPSAVTCPECLERLRERAGGEEARVEAQGVGA